MDYVVGSIADLISGNVTPNRPKIAKRALTPTKHMPSPNVTPKSEFVSDRSVFLSPTMQKRQAIVKKSPKRIFQNPDLDVTNENVGNLSTTSPKADKVKKHLKNELESKTSLNTSSEIAKSPKKKRKSAESSSPKKNVTEDDLNSSSKDNPSTNELTPKKKKKKQNSAESSSPKKNVTEDYLNSSSVDNPSTNELTPKKKKKKRNSAPEEVPEEVMKPLETCSNEGTPKKKKIQKNTSVSGHIKSETQLEEAIVNGETNASVESPKKKKKNKNKVLVLTTEHVPDDNIDENNETKESKPKKKNRKRKKSKNKQAASGKKETEDQVDEEGSKPKKIKKIKVNPNAVTDKDSDSEHESDNEIESENEEINKQVLETSADVADDSSDEEEAPKPKKKEKIKKSETEKVREVNTEEEVKRTLFVGNVPFSEKCKKQIKKIFSKYGEIQSVRIRTVPVKDARMTPKVAVIKQELHPERSTVNVYVKFANPESVEEALAENNTVLNNYHLRVTRSVSTGAEYDPRRSIFVGNMPFALEDEALREKFQGCGEIESVRIVRDRKTNAGKGFGYVNFVSKDGVELALALTEEDLTIKNRIMRVKRCTQATQRQSQKNFQGHKKNFQQKGFHGKRVSQGDRQRNMQGQRGFKQGGNFQSRGSFGQQKDGQKDGAYRRVMNKRKSQEAGDGPPSKMSRDGAPREKKPRKEFVGITAEKKKKHKFDKGQKKKKALSEILTKYNT